MLEIGLELGIGDSFKVGVRDRVRVYKEGFSQVNHHCYRNSGTLS